MIIFYILFGTFVCFIFIYNGIVYFSYLLARKNKKNTDLGHRLNVDTLFKLGFRSTIFSKDVKFFLKNEFPMCIFYKFF